MFNLMSRVNETRFISGHESLICKCRLNGGVSNVKQRTDWATCDNNYIRNGSISDCEFNRLYKIGDYLDYKKYKYKKRWKN